MIKTGETGSRTEKQRRAARRSSSRWKQRAQARRASRSRSGAIRKTPVSTPNGQGKKAKRISLRFKPPQVGRVLSGLRRDDTSLPSWRDLTNVAGRSSSRPRSADFLERISTVRFVLMLAVVALAATLYVGHIHATQTLVADLEQAKRHNMELHLQHNRLRGDFDRMTGPALIAERAHGLGLEEGVAYRPAILLTISDD